ncbi:transposable element Tcb2 transposase [Trichonephila clavipes]|nr:transposable element Tcb2 transposase [Trichonephila clavipes]
MITNFFIPELNNQDVQELWFQQDGAACHTARATIDLLKDTFGDRLISRFGPVNWPLRSCDLTPLDYFLWGYVKSLVYADKPQTLDHLEDNIRRVIADIRPQMLEKVIENWTSRLDYIRASRGSPMPKIIFKIIVGLREAGLSYRAVAARVQRNSSTIMRVSKQWTDEGRTARKSVSGPRNVTSAREDRCLQDNARPHVAKTVKSYLDSQQVQLLPWPAYSPDMSPIEREWDIVGRRIARDLRPVASTDELWLRIQTIWNTLPQTDIKNLFNSMPRRVAALIAARGGHTKY